ncbi:MAG: peptidoglycan DD-metalloendopeptidase family protein [Chloroflexi bacterium]|nr:peptidoglycan DD-metalloendopeptidase family protein [Chloroflexota bacterium]
MEIERAGSNGASGGTTATPAPATTVTSDCTGTIINSFARVRASNTTRSDEVGQLSQGDSFPILEVKQEAGTNFKWMRTSTNGMDGWIREDLLAYDGECGDYGLTPVSTDLYPSPMRNYVWVRGYTGPNGHWGWDLGGPGGGTGEPILGGPNGGKVESILRCTRCTAAAPSTIEQGLSLGDSSVLSDPAWGYGFGNYVRVLYTNDQLPESTRQALAQQGLEGANIFAIYAHLDEISVSQGQVISANQQVGTCGNTGNSTGPHLHLEIRASMLPTISGWLRLTLLDPTIMFSR